MREVEFRVYVIIFVRTQSSHLNRSRSWSIKAHVLKMHAHPVLGRREVMLTNFSYRIVKLHSEHKPLQLVGRQAAVFFCFSMFDGELIFLIYTVKSRNNK